MPDGNFPARQKRGGKEQKKKAKKNSPVNSPSSQKRNGFAVNIFRMFSGFINNIPSCCQPLHTIGQTKRQSGRDKNPDKSWINTHRLQSFSLFYLDHSSCT